MAEDDVPFDPADLRAMWDFGDLPATDARFAALAASLDPGSVRAAELVTQRARVCGLAGQFDDGHRMLDGLRGGAHPVVRARIALERGRLLNSAGDASASIPYFLDAVQHVRDAGRDDLVGDAFHMLAIVDAERAVDWYTQGIAVANASADAEGRRWLGPLHNNYGWTLHDAGEYDEALVTFGRARDAYGETGNAESIRIADWTIARCLRSLGRWDEALAIQRRLKAEGPPDVYVDEELAILEMGKETLP